MHVPKFFEITDPAVIAAFLADNGFATLVSRGDSYPLATHIPLLMVPDGANGPVLQGHISKANEQCADLLKSPQVLAIFLSPVHHYISSSWYGHPNAPTWNYMSVHVSGHMRILTGDELWQSVSRLTDKYEQYIANPVSLDRLPPAVQQQMNGIVGFEISMDKVEAAFKLSQNRNAADHARIISELRASGTPLSLAMADAMLAHQP